MRLGRLGLALGVLFAGGAAYTWQTKTEESRRIVTGKYISPVGEQTEVGSFPINIAASPDGKYLVLSNIGFRQQLSVIEVATGKLVNKVVFATTSRTDRGLYYGLAFQQSGGKNVLFASQGADDRIAQFELTADGQLNRIGTILDPAPKTSTNIPHNVAGLALTGDGQTLLAVNNQSHEGNNFTGSLSVIDLSQKQAMREITVPAFPYAVVAITKGANADKRAYVSCERDSSVVSVDLASGAVTPIQVGDGPTGLLLNRDQTRLYVTNSRSDTLTTVDTATNKVISTVLLRQGDLRGLPGVTPLGMTLSPDEKMLYVALADMHAVGVIDTEDGKLEGMIPAGWYPTSVAVSPDGLKLFVANAKGTQARNPNGAKVRDWGTYAPNILEGTVAMIDLPKAQANLKPSTELVLNNNLAIDGAAAAVSRRFTRPDIKHVIYVIKENRTYDQVFGDMEKGNGDPSLCLFPREVTPNQHALAERFALLDNFYVCAEVSFDGWTWSTQGIANAYIERNVPYNYSGRGRSYDSEGTNNGTAVELQGMRDISMAQNGYIWDAAHRAGVSVRNYGFFVESEAAKKDAAGKVVEAEHQEATKKFLMDRTCKDFREFDMAFPDSDAGMKLGVLPAPKQLLRYGSHRDTSRMSTFEREFQGYVRRGDLPGFITIRLPRNHTSGTSDGMSSPQAMVADNDYAVGRLVDMVSHSPYWKTTAICILEDDAQAGTDHVDCHRSPGLVISPYVEKNKLDSRFYNTDSMLRTIELLLGLKPLSNYDAIASPIDVFGKDAVNDAPFAAILPAKEIIGQVNRRTAYRSADSTRLISRFAEESMPDFELNDILWGSIKGAKSPRPATRGVQWHAVKDADD